MKSYLLLFFSTLLLLFILFQPDRRLNGYACAVKSELTEADNLNKRSVKRTCARKCLKHQTHSRQQNAANVTTNCSQQFYAIVADTQQEEQYFLSYLLPLSQWPPLQPESTSPPTWRPTPIHRDFLKILVDHYQHN